MSTQVGCFSCAVADSLPSGDLWATIAGMYSSSVSVLKQYHGHTYVCTYMSSTTVIYGS